MKKHFFIKYGESVVRFLRHIPLEKSLTDVEIADVLEKSMSHFRLEQHKGHVTGSKEVSYRFGAIEKGDPKGGIFLAPNALISDIDSRFLWASSIKILKQLRANNSSSSEKALQSFFPLAGEFLNFGSSGAIGRGKPTICLQDAGYAAIAALTRYKPSLQYTKINESPVNTALIPDLELEQLNLFLKLWDELSREDKKGTQLKGRRIETISENNVSAKLIRPEIFSGNFPGVPRSSAMCGLALLASLGEAIRNIEENERQIYLPLMDALATAPVYMIQYGNAKVFRFNNYVVQLAKGGELRPVIDSVYYSTLYSVGKRLNEYDKSVEKKVLLTNLIEYQKFDFFYSRFLQLFTRPSFNDFMSFRAEYPKQIIPLFNTYFTQHPSVMERIPRKAVDSARAIGNWINRQAYLRAVKELEENKRDKDEGKPYWADLDKLKTKFLVSVESLIFSAKEGDDIIGQLAVTVGRATGEEFPKEAEVFFTQVATGDVTPSQAKNLLMAFSRVSTRDSRGTKAETSSEEATGDAYSYDADAEENQY